HPKQNPARDTSQAGFCCLSPGKQGPVRACADCAFVVFVYPKPSEFQASGTVVGNAEGAAPAAKSPRQGKAGPRPSPRFSFSAAQATIIAALLAAFGAVVGHVVSGWTTRETALLNAQAELDQQARRLTHEIAQQNEKQQHEISLERQRFVQQTISAAIARGTEEEQRRALRFYATIGIIAEPYAQKILDLPQDKLPVAAQVPTAAIAPFGGRLWREGSTLGGLTLPRLGIVDGKVVSQGDIDVDFIPAASIGGPFEAADPRFIVLDFASTDAAAGLVSAFSRPQTNASVHFVISRDGGMIQMVPLDRIAWHAGTSEWKGLRGLNARSIGIDFVNNGQLHRRQDGVWMTWDGKAVPEARVCAQDTPSGNGTVGFECYSEAQIATSVALVRALKQSYPTVTEVVTQADISPGRKIGPGPAFPLMVFR
ncbi:N-acetylmuramoyl-L-alanine amidase, partial [Ancylobacter polymorphus]